MILLTGAGGKTGRNLVRVLSKVNNVCAFAYREEYVPVLESLGAEKVLIGDMRDESAIHSAMQGVRSVYHICPNMDPDEEEIGKFSKSQIRSISALRCDFSRVFPEIM